VSDSIIKKTAMYQVQFDMRQDMQDDRDRLAMENMQLRQALMDAINQPKGVVPDSAMPFYRELMYENTY